MLNIYTPPSSSKMEPTQSATRRHPPPYRFQTLFAKSLRGSVMSSQQSPQSPQSPQPLPRLLRLVSLATRRKLSKIADALSLPSNKRVSKRRGQPRATTLPRVTGPRDPSRNLPSARPNRIHLTPAHRNHRALSGQRKRLSPPHSNQRNTHLKPRSGAASSLSSRSSIYSSAGYSKSVHSKPAMRGFFSGNRQTQELGPPPDAPASSGKEETIQALRRRQKAKQRDYIAQMLRAQKEIEVAEQQNDPEKLENAEVTRRAMNEAADALAAQVAILERIMEEAGLTEELEDERRETEELAEETREEYENGVAEAEEQMRQVAAQGEYVSTLASSLISPTFDEDEAMRDLDEHAKQTGRA